MIVRATITTDDGSMAEVKTWRTTPRRRIHTSHYLAVPGALARSWDGPEPVTVVIRNPRASEGQK
jgi:hypothetical protein